MRLPNQRVLWAVSLGHTANDMFMSLRSVLLVFISAYMMPMTGGQIGLAVSAVELSGALSQPFFGLLADRTGGRLLGSIGVAWTVSFMLLAMLTVTLGGSYWMMVIPLALAGLGSGAFHPVGSMHAVDAEPQRAARNAAFFFLFGQLGLGLGPALAGLLLDRAHTNYNSFFGPALGPAFPRLFIEQGSVVPLFVLALIALPAALLMALTIPNRAAYFARKPRTSVQSNVPRAALNKRAFAIFGAAVALRSLSAISVITFTSLIFQLKGWTPAQYGLLVSVFWVASGLSGMVFGALGDRYDSRRVVMLSLLVAAPFIFLLPDLTGVFAFVAMIIIGAMGGSHSLVVVLAQNMLPGRRGFASGAILGFIFASGALGNLVMGSLIDSLGPATTYQIVAGVTVVGGMLWLLLPNPRRPRPLPADPAPQDVVAPVRA
jgi:FSR family fosmidomycin resistance protein-like MFS transporter